MKKYFVILVGLMSFVATPALAEYYAPQVQGRKARKQIRHMLFVDNLTGAQRVVYEKHGFTAHRLRTNHAGRVTERWQYLEQGLEFVFDHHSKELLETREIQTEHRRDWYYQ